MFKLKVLAVGKMKEPFWRGAQEEFVKRLGPAARVEVVEVAAERLGGSVTDEEAMRRESERLVARVPDGAAVVALDKSGVQEPSERFARSLEEIGRDGTAIVFLIGGAAGLHAEVLARADRKLSLSEMTLPHELARVFLLEQLYRATQILQGGKYHR
ncbi:23S rRNA (pseudouridine(1915)-N(3))-methyltransferase RlmH [Patescibacteria group bacterium]